jgi:succinate-semialdehyde dehydrogenase / glutarate-semialdehyde dehydrogenase
MISLPSISIRPTGFATVNPSTGEEIEAFSYYTPTQTEKVVASADKSFQSFRKLSVHERAQLFADLGNTLRKNKAQLAKVISMEMGKIFSEAEAEIEKCAHEADPIAVIGRTISRSAAVSRRILCAVAVAAQETPHEESLNPSCLLRRRQKRLL